ECGRPWGQVIATGGACRIRRQNRLRAVVDPGHGRCGLCDQSTFPTLVNQKACRCCRMWECMTCQNSDMSRFRPLVPLPRPLTRPSVHQLVIGNPTAVM